MRRSADVVSRGILVAIVCLTGVLAACRKAEGPTSTFASSSPFEWLAGLRTAIDPRELNADTDEVKALVDRAVVASPIICFAGIPRDYADAGYVLGVIAPSRESLDALVHKVGREPLFEVRVRRLCVD